MCGERERKLLGQWERVCFLSESSEEWLQSSEQRDGMTSFQQILCSCIENKLEEERAPLEYRLCLPLIISVLNNIDIDTAVKNITRRF